MTPPTFSVIVPTFDRQELLDASLDSIRRQTISSLECIVVDDGSPVEARLPFEDPRFRIVRLATNRGIAAARNVGLDAAQGQYAAFLDDDDLWTPRRLEIGLRHLRNGVVTVCGMGTIGSRRHNPPRVRQPFADEVMNGNPPHLGAAALTLSECPRFDESFAACEDLEWWMRVAPRFQVVEEPEIGWLYRRHAGLRVGHGTSARIDGSLKLLAQYADYFSSHPSALAYRHLRIGWMRRHLGQRSEARAEALSALRADPRPRTMARSLRLMVGR